MAIEEQFSQLFVVFVFNMGMLKLSAFSFKGPLRFFFRQLSDYKSSGEVYR